MPDSRAFRILVGASIAVLITTAAVSAGWQVFAASASEPRWMLRVDAAGWFVAMSLTAAAALVLLLGRRRSRD